MAKGKIFYNNLTVDSTIDVSSEAPGFEKEYLVKNNQGVVWRSESLSVDPVPVVSMIFPSPINVSGVVVLNHNLLNGDEIYFECSNNADFDDISPGNFVYTSGNFVNTGFTEVAWSQSYYRLRMIKNSTGDFCQVGEVYLVGEVYEFERNYNWNYTLTKEINRNSKETTSGQIYRKTRYIRKGFSLDFDGINDVQKETFETISENDYICLLPSGASCGLYYGIIDFSSYTHVYSNYWTANITFTESPK